MCSQTDFHDFSKTKMKKANFLPNQMDPKFLFLAKIKSEIKNQLSKVGIAKKNHLQLKCRLGFLVMN